MSPPSKPPEAVPSNGALSPPGGDGLPYPPDAVPGVSPPPALPEATPERVICLRGPCRHYWRIETNIEYGNPAGTFEELGIAEPKLITTRCLVQDGVEMDMAETDVHECNQWSPREGKELVQLTRRRKKYFQEHPEHDPSCQDVFIEDARPSWWRRWLLLRKK